MSAAYDLDAYQKTDSWLGPATVLKGTLKFSSSVRISGKFEGEIESGGYLYVECGADARADPPATTLAVGGTVRGNLEAYEKIEMLPTGKIYGNVRTAKLRIADGVIFEGKCEMIKRGDMVDVFSAPIQQLKKSMQGV
ncbi:MAG: polymer-forming cytoskeletal protein [Spirochaetales bacterium]|jgi:cytoskeletal protein CcmA (bactofilin family)|nr:polymer-forming cytoskeletal protein [Spirochaetales bacterium]